MGRMVAIVPAGGVGARAIAPDFTSSAAFSTKVAAVPKQYHLIAGVPMIRRSVLALLADSRIDQVIVAIQPGDMWAEAVLSDLPRVSLKACAGATRALTVLGALHTLSPEMNLWVLVHDAARPGLTRDALARLIDTCLPHPVGGLLALPAADTLKQSQPDITQPSQTDIPLVRKTLKRDDVWLAQTPQMFQASVLKTALQGALDAGFDVTDEASAMEWAGHAPLLVRGSVTYAKVTWPEDFEWVGSWLSKQK